MIQVTILGTGAGGPFQGRNYTAHHVQCGSSVFLVDCGEGTQHQLYKRTIKYDQCEEIFITHLHGDHVFGLMGILTNWCLKKRTTPLHLYAPEGLQKLVESTSDVCGIRFPYHLHFHEINTEIHAKVFENAQLEVWSIPLHHRTAVSGWLFREKSKPRNMRPEMIEQYGIHFSEIPDIKEGKDWVAPDGSIVSNLELTIDPPTPASYAFCSDTAPFDAVVACVQGVDLLYHEATFTDEHEEEALISYHSTARQAAEIAKKSGVKTLLLGHFSGRYTDETVHFSEASSVFPNVYTAFDGDVWEIKHGLSNRITSKTT